MKSILRYMLRATMVASIAFAVSCIDDGTDFAEYDNDINPENGVTSDDNEGTGYFSMADVTLSVNNENELMSTRTSSYPEADDDYLIFIYNDNTGKEHYSDNYATTKGLTDPLTLPVGEYTISATSIETVPAAEWDAPHYASTNYSFSIGSDKTTAFEDEIICKMSNIKTDIEISADLRELFKSEDLNEEEGDVALQVLLELGDASILYTADETRSGYFAAQDDDDSINVTLSGMYNTAAANQTPHYEFIEWKQTIPSVTAGQARHISIQIANYNEGVLEIIFVVTSWVYDSPLGVNTSETFYPLASEDEIYDPDSDASDAYSPTITIDGVESLTHYIYPAQFDDVAMTYDPTYTINMTPETGSEVVDVMLMFSSTNEELTTLFSDAGFGSSLIVWDDESFNSDLTSWLTVSKDSTTGALTASATYEAMKILSDNRGTHTLKLIVNDNENRRSVTSLIINSVASDKLEILWRDGYSFDVTHEIMYTTDANYVELPVVFDIYSKTGLTAMTIKITSEVLTPAELLKMNLAQEMDLITPATSAMEASLRELGFPVGDEIKNATELVFNITDFMPMLAMLSDVGSKDISSFLITVSDESGTTNETLTVERK